MIGGRIRGGWIPPTRMVGGDGGGGIGTGEIAVSGGPAVGSVNLTTQGAIDWLVVDGGMPLTAQSDAQIHRKRAGGWIRDSWRWDVGALGLTFDTRPAWLYTATQADNGRNAALAGVAANIQGTNTNSSGVDGLGWGFSFRVPCSPTARTLKWQGTLFSALVRASVKFSDPAIGAAQSATVTALAPSSGYDYMFTCGFTGPVGSEIVVTTVVESVVGISTASRHLYCGAVWVS